MLQQTQVEAVIPFYRRFLDAFPTVGQLAAARTERVLTLWSGLGYYRRARHLQAAARDIVTRFAGSFPRDYEAARSLPGVGDYTARAVLSIAYGLPYAVLDGNVARVLARLLTLEGHAHQPDFRRAVSRELDLVLSRRRPGDFNQALMELGQTICLPRNPLCTECPLNRWCEGHRQGRPEAYPFPRPRRASERTHLAVGVLRRNSTTAGTQVAMVRGLDDGLLSDLWNFPSALGPSAAEARDRLQTKLATMLGSQPSIGPPLGDVRHGITYRSIEGRLYQVEGFRFAEPAPSRTPKTAGGELRWFPLRSLKDSAVSQLAKKIALAIQ